ncbi:hypoxia-inducible factor 1-alpha-like isoform X2 [Belonocnema kinseyi]|uniref:hypoxia-inducible factor 1-alpha-like isoform X2 n=1 Tax=Belonocnema kinseyi TaxID=2817044 RepID=UPI00143D75F4|nr:hypoxia-inducible factor 1-alpha-like isoform X2 [Belonocnema kinseyi]
MWPHEQRQHFSLDNSQHCGLFNNESSGHQRRVTAMDIVPGPSNPRASRNLAEKQRRDNLNSNISTMASLLPMVAGNSRKTDKISILRLAGAYLRHTYTLGTGKAGFLPSKFNGLNLEQFIIDNMCENGGFFLVVTTTGKIVYIGQHVEQLLGHAQTQLLGESLFHYVCPEDHEELTKNLTRNEAEPSTSFMTDLVDENSSSSEDVPFKEEQRRSFTIRLAQRTVSRREHAQYECFHISGNLCIAKACKKAGSNVNRLKQRETTGTGNDVIFVGIARLLKKRTITDLSLLEADKDEYVTRHLVDGRIIFCDHRISIVAGYMAEEVSGKSAFAFMHKDDFRWTMIGLRQMYNKGEGFGQSCYRLVARNGEFIYLRTHGYLEFDKTTQTVESFVCVNTLMTQEEGEELIKEMKQRFSATINNLKDGTDFSLTFEDLGSDDAVQSNDVACVEDPSRLEDAITDLISDLPSTSITEDQLAPSPIPDPQFYKAAIYSKRLPPASEQLSRMCIKGVEPVVRGKGKGKGSRSPKSSTPIKKPVYPDKKIPELDDIPSPGSQNQPTTPVAEKLMPIAEKKIPEHSCQSSPSIPETENVSSTSYVRSSGLQEFKPFEVKLERVGEGLEAQEFLLNAAQCPSISENLGINFKRRFSEELNPSLVDDEEKSANANPCTSIEASSNELCPGTSSNLQLNLKRKFSENADPDVNSSKRLLKEAYPLDHPVISTDPGNFNSCVDVQQCNYLYKNLAEVEVTEVSLPDRSSEYPTLDPASFVLPVSGELIDLRDLQDLPESNLERNPDWVRIIDKLRPVVDFENSFDERRTDQLMEMLNEHITRSQLELVHKMDIREPQFDELERDLAITALHPQREMLNQLQADHKVQKQLLKTLQKEHQNIQSIRW